MAGVVVAFAQTPVGQLINDLATIAICGNADDFANEVIYLPL